MPASSLLTSSSLVEIPYVAVKIGDYSFGLYNRTKSNIEVNGKYYSAVKVNYPNYIESLSVKKVNGTLNTYTLVLKYPITDKDDPNLIDKIFSTVSKDRKIIFMYGDCANPSFMYRNEVALMTKVTSSVDVASSAITYNITAVSSALGLKSNVKNFPGYSNKKPSDVIKQLLANKNYGLQEIFYGMHSIEKVNQLGLIPGDDKPVKIQAKKDMNILDYLNYLTACMSNINDVTGTIDKTYRYVMTIHDDTSEILDGPYFRIDKVATTLTEGSSPEYYTIDVGYPNKDFVMNFSIDNDQAYSILYEYSKKLNFTDYTYRVGDDGEVKEIYSPALANSKSLSEMTEVDKTWWSQVTQYPIKATLTLKGLLRASVLMSYIRVNVYFYGKKHSSSGVYNISQQVDTISSSGYRTQLSLVKIQGDTQ